MPKAKLDNGFCFNLEKEVKPHNSYFINYLTNSSRNPSLLSYLHHGNIETGLKDSFGFLNLNEIVAFEIVTWQARNDSENYSKLLNDLSNASEPYELFKRVNSAPVVLHKYDGSIFSSYSNIFELIGINKKQNLANLNDNQIKRFENQVTNYNPFGKDLEKRLEIGMTKNSFESLKDKIAKKPRVYCETDCKYQNKKAARFGDNSIIVPLGFFAYPMKDGFWKKVSDKYASKIVKQLTGFNLSNFGHDLSVDLSIDSNISQHLIDYDIYKSDKKPDWIVEDYHVSSFLGDEPNNWHVRKALKSNSDGNFVMYDCDCPDYVLRKHKKQPCKHIDSLVSVSKNDSLVSKNKWG
jgi:uncharacterized protein YutD